MDAGLSWFKLVLNWSWAGGTSLAKDQLKPASTLQNLPNQHVFVLFVVKPWLIFVMVRECSRVSNIDSVGAQKSRQREKSGEMCLFMIVHWTI